MGISEEKFGTSPILIRGMSRSGGTLLTSMFDAHPNVAMSYELYPNLLKISPNDNNYFLKIAKRIEKLDSLKSISKEIPVDGFLTFVLRSYRSGIDHWDIAKLIKAHIQVGDNFSEYTGYNSCRLHSTLEMPGHKLGFQGLHYPEIHWNNLHMPL